MLKNSSEKRSILRQFAKKNKFPSVDYGEEVPGQNISNSYHIGYPNSPFKLRPLRKAYSKKSVLSSSPTKSVSRLKLKKKKKWRVTELEIENSNLRKELQRSQRVLSIALTRLSDGGSPIHIVEEYLKQSMYVELLQQENAKFRIIFDNSYHVDKDKQLISRLAEKIQGLQQQSQLFEENLLKNKRNLGFSLRKQKGPSLIHEIYRACCLHRLDIDELGYIVNPNDLSNLSIPVMLKGFRAIGLILEEKDLKSLISSIIGYEVENISQKALIAGLKSRNSGFPEYFQILPSLTTLKIAFASMSLTKKDLISDLSQEKYSSEQFLTQLQTDGLVLPQNTLQNILKIIFADQEQLPPSVIVNNIFGMFDEIIISEAAEKEFDKKIQKNMRGRWEEFLQLCEAKDIFNASAVDIKDFSSICKQIGSDFVGEIFEYLLVLFYGKTSEIGKAPYLYFYLKYNV